ncbi:MAG: hypothetical protein RQ735_10900 [Flavobacteriaceae bacterium]|nr:hypothetical protein [Flavobacteriaceae bacterium]
MLKKFVFILPIVCFFIACDDGDVSVSSLNIDPSTAFTCDVQNPFPLYNIDQNEVLILNLNNSLFAPQVTGDVPRTATLNNGQVIYRFFTDNVNQGFFCSVIPPLDPKPVEEFLSTGGIAEISTRLNTNELGDTISFTHDVVLLNLSLEQGDRQIRREELFYGFITIPKQ